jgi:lysophospholipase L1-like esterase
MRLRPVVPAVVAAGALALLGLAGPPTAAQADRPTAVVSLGDSWISGEGAGNYEPGTDQAGDFCHRSLNSEIHQTHIPGVQATVNLACSGATTDDVRLGGNHQNGELPQAEKLRTTAANYRVKAVVLTIGANNVGFSSIVLDCIKAYFLLGPRCQDTWNPQVPAKLAAAVPGIEQNLRDIRTVMRDDGYADGDYQLILQSYSSPAPTHLRYNLTRSLEGCPFRQDDVAWAHNTTVPEFSQYLGQAARGVPGVKYLDLNGAFTGREICADGISHSQEWVNGLVIDASEILNGLGENLVQQSFHPNAAGHVEMGGCLTEFVASSASTARCARGGDGNLHLTT